MKNQINIAELLKDCPKGMELDCTMWNGVVFDEVDSEAPNYPIGVRIKNGAIKWLTADGKYDLTNDAKCVIFPKSKTTWKGFVPPCKFKEGDVIFKYNFIAIIHLIEEGGKIWYHCWFNTKHENYKLKKGYGIGNINDGDEVRLATEEEKAKLFKVIKENGFKWNDETKTLEELIEPKFKVGDRVRNKYYKDYIYDIHDITDKGYRAKEIDADSPIIILFGSPEDNYELVPNKFDITTLKPFESRVLVRDGDNGTWHPSFWGYYEKCSCYAYNTIRGFYNQCIPYEGNEHLLGTKGDCEEYFKTWE